MTECDRCRYAGNSLDTSAPKFTKDCMCDKYTNCTDCQQHDTTIRNATLDDLYLNYKKRYVEDAIDEIRRSLRTQEHP